MNDILGIMKIINSLGNTAQTDWQKRLREQNMANKTGQEDMQQPSLAGAQPTGKSQKMFDNQMLNNLASGMSVQDSLMAPTMNKYNALKSIFSKFGG